MDSKNIRTATAVAVVVIVVLIGSWQVYGQRDGTMEDEWTVVYASTTSSELGTALDVGETMGITEDGGILSASHGDSVERFLPVSDREALSMEDGAFIQLFLSGDVLYRFEISYYHVEQAVMTRDGSPASDTVPDAIGNIVDMTVDAHVDRGMGEVYVSIDVTAQNGRLVDLVDASGTPGWGFVMNDGDRTVVQCVFEDSSGACVVNDGDYVGVSGGSVRDGFGYMYIGDSDGRISEDVLGITGEKEVSIAGTTGPLTFRYDDGFLFADGGVGETAYSSYAWTVGGEGYFGAYSRIGIIPYGDMYRITGLAA